MLTKPHISELNLEGSTLDLLAEFLALYFNGQPHDVGGNAAVPFPQVDTLFQQSPLEQPLSRPCITVVWNNPATVRREWETVNGTRQQMYYARVSITFYIRASAPATDQGNARALCARTASLLAGVLGNTAATQPLAQKGVRRLRPSLPQAVLSTTHVLRLLHCGLTLKYPVLSQVN